MSKPRGSSRSWRERQEADPFVARARKAGLRSRAAFKIEELLQLPQDLPVSEPVVVDLGAAPGGWSQFLARKFSGRARIVAVDLLDMESIEGVDFVLGDFRNDEVLAEIRRMLNGSAAHLVMSDMAPNITGMRSVDQPRAMYLAELALDFAGVVLGRRGTFVCKVFQGEGFDAFVADCRSRFGTVQVKKPKASRASSREVYVLARNYLMV